MGAILQFVTVACPTSTTSIRPRSVAAPEGEARRLLCRRSLKLFKVRRSGPSGRKFNISSDGRDRSFFNDSVCYFASQSNNTQISLSNDDSYPKFHRWRGVTKSGIAVDFLRVLRSNSGFVLLENLVLDLAAFEE
jgi:hypothetical protein